MELSPNLADGRGAVGAPRFELPSQYRHHRVVTQFIMVVEVLAKRNREHRLTHQRVRQESWQRIGGASLPRGKA
jgi:hypothetical protein